MFLHAGRCDGSTWHVELHGQPPQSAGALRRPEEALRDFANQRSLGNKSAHRAELCEPAAAVRLLRVPPGDVRAQVAGTRGPGAGIEGAGAARSRGVLDG